MGIISLFESTIYTSYRKKHHIPRPQTRMVATKMMMLCLLAFMAFGMSKADWDTERAEKELQSNTAIMECWVPCCGTIKQQVLENEALTSVLGSVDGIKTVLESMVDDGCLKYCKKQGYGACFGC